MANRGRDNAKLVSPARQHRTPGTTRRLAAALGAATAAACGQVAEVPPATEPAPAKPPVADVRPHSFTMHGYTVEDPYRWLKDDSYPTVDDADVLAYLKAENAYFEAMMAPRQLLVDTLFDEIKGRQQDDDANVPARDGDYYYQWRFAPGGQYRIWSRWPAEGEGASEGPTADAEVILDEPALAKGHEYFRRGALSVSHNGRLLAYSTDTTGGERYTLRIKDLATGELLPNTIENTQGDPVWAKDDAAFFYTVVDDQWRPYQVRLHVLADWQAGAEKANADKVIYEEEDPGFFVSVYPLSSKKYVAIYTGAHTTSEVRLVPAADPLRPPLVVSPRRTDHEYALDHQGDRFIIRTNDTHKNTRLATATEDDPSPANWQELVAPSDERYILGLQAFADFIAVQERVDGVDQIRILGRDGTDAYVEFPEATRTVGLGENAEFDTRSIRLDYSSMVTPNTVFDYALDAGQLRPRKVRQIPSGYEPAHYVTERLNAPARDGASIPVSIVYRKGFRKDGTAPVYLYGYGAYGNAMMPSFATARLSLLDRGFAYAIAHVRGGDELGYHWYEAGKLERRTNTFNDFVDVARYLIAEQVTSPGRIAIAGGSAGGELMGAVVNQAPELWGAVAAHVPFVDVLNTMLDTSLPLTPIEWPEWGNPIEDKAAFELIRSYSPYDQLKAGAYPPMLVTAGLNDPRVTYWEPAKYVAKLRTLKTDANPLLLKTNMGAGHGGKSGRYDSLYEVAEEYAFMLWALGMADEAAPAADAG